MAFGFIKKEGKNSFSLTLNFFLLTIIFALISLFSAQTLATASESNEAGDSTSKSVPAIEEILRLGLTPSLRMTCVEGLSSLSWMTDGDNASTQATVAERQPMYRLYNKYTGEHHYTSSASERDKVIAAGWNDEGVGWYAPSTSSTPVYRVYNSYAQGGEHHYTRDKDEIKTLVKEGWTDEGIGWYSIDETEKDKTPVYRQYNPNQFSCNHNYTINESE